MKRIQRITALDNDGHQADWTKRLQSIADKRNAQAYSSAKWRRPGQRQRFRRQENILMRNGRQLPPGILVGSCCMLPPFHPIKHRLHPPRKMNTGFLYKVFERMHGRTLASVIAAGSKDTDGQVCEKTVRNWSRNRTTPDSETLELLVAGGRQNMHKRLEEQAWPAEARQTYVDTLSKCPGFVSTFVASLQNGDARYFATIELACHVDRLEQALDDHKASENLQGWVQTFLEAGWIQDEHLTNPDDDTSADEMRRMIREAKSWADLTVPMAVFMVHIQFQLLATLDLEFCSKYLVEFEATPIFASLLPRLNPRAPTSSGTIPLVRDHFHYPTRRLLDVTACIRALRVSPVRNWPTDVPSVGDMATWLDLAGCGKLASNLLKWRSGRTITMERFGNLWEGCFGFHPTNERPPTPAAMLYAVTVFTELFVKGSRKDRNLIFIAPDLAFYQHWWDIQHRKLSTGTEPLCFGTRKWMPDLV